MDHSSSGGQSDRQGSRPRGNRNRRQRQKAGNKGNRQNPSLANTSGGKGSRPTKSQGQNRQDPNRSRNRQRGSGNRSNWRRQPPAVSWWRKILSILTFGQLGKSDSKPQQEKKAKRPEAKAVRTPLATRSGQGGERPSRKAVIQEVTSPRLFVGNLDYEANESDLEDLFKGAGHVVNVEIATNPRTQQSKGFGFVEMSHLDEARRAVTILHDQDFRGRKLIVSGARNEGSRSQEDLEAGAEAKTAIDPKPLAAPEPERNQEEADNAAA